MAKKLILTGLPHIDAKLRTLDVKVANKCVRPALRKGAKVLLEATVNNTPIDTGSLRQSIKIRTSSRNKALSFRVGVGGKDYVGKTFFGSFLEFGYKHGSRKLDSDKRKPIAGLHFVKGAFLHKKEQAKQTAIDEIKKRLDKAIKEK